MCWCVGMGVVVVVSVCGCWCECVWVGEYLCEMNYFLNIILTNVNVLKYSSVMLTNGA